MDLTDHDPDGETKVVAAALYAASDRSDRELLEAARKLSADDRARVLAAYVGERRNRRHKPGRAFERTSYRFDVLCDYGAFRDLQRHRLLTLEWQRLTPAHGFALPEELAELGAADDWRRVMEESSSLHGALVDEGLGDAAQYAVAMAYRVRFYMEMNAREAMHLVELRSAPQGHPTYRLVAQRMHELIADVHPAIAGDHDLRRPLAGLARAAGRGTAVRGPARGSGVVTLLAITREGWYVVGFVALAVAGVAIAVAGAILLLRQRRR